MKPISRIVVLMVVLFAPAVAHAQDPAAALAQCLTDSTTGKDRKDLLRWLFFSIGAHPDIKQYLTPAVPQAATDADRTMAALLTRIFTETCTTQTRAAVQQVGAQAVQTAFSLFGQVAMRELMISPEVSAAMNGFEKYLDQQKLNQALRPN